ncbi:MAG: SDR family NAD(P)-dependent oxidoreductase [Pseudomonadota bacterium]
MSQKVALVTGVGKKTGLGFAVTQGLLSLKMTVYLTARTQDQADRMAELLSGQAAVVPMVLDVSDPASIAEVTARIEAEQGKLDVLINNAAMLAPFGERAATADLSDARKVFDVVLFGTWALCRSMLPLLRQSPAGRVVNVSSGAGSHGDPAFGLTTDNQLGTSYAVSKAALNALTVKLAREEEGSAVKINAVCPGFTATFEGGSAMGAGPPEESAKGIIWAATLPESGPTAGFFRDREPLLW